MRRSTLAILTAGCLAAPAAADGPKPVPPQFAGVGRMAPDLAAPDLAGQPVTLSELLKARKAVVVALTSTSCPVSKKYLPALARLEQEYGPKGIGFVYLNPIAADRPDDARKLVEDLKLTGPYLHDRDGSLAKALGAASTGDAFVLDATRTVVYRGAVDDQYGVSYSLDAPRRRFLADALDAVLAGREVTVKATEAPGCVLDLSDVKPAAAAPVTYHNRISRIVQRHCQECHRDGGVGPFSLETHADVVAHRGMIRRVVERGTMPPWFAAPPPDGEHSKWANDRSLPEADRADLLAWLAGGTPEGDPADAPLPRSFPTEWAIGTPDLVVQIPRPVRVKAEGTMPYQNVVVETGLTEDRWVRAVEIRPTAPAVVHHVLVFRVDDSAGGLLARVRDGGSDRLGFFAAYVPGNTYQAYPDGFGKKLPKGARLRFQIHYTPNGTATEDQMRIGFVFADRPPRHELKVVGLSNLRISIPPGAADHPESAQLRLPVDAVVTAFMPHMHVRGKSCRYEMTPPGGESVTLLHVPRYDFNWQLRYELAEPLQLSRGTVLRFTARFDNSDRNPANPDPTKTVRWGQQTYDEMLLGYVEYYLP
jgi:peroxiredoxin/mono/diheme cytochrome c family protein